MEGVAEEGAVAETMIAIPTAAAVAVEVAADAVEPLDAGDYLPVVPLEFIS